MVKRSHADKLWHEAMRLLEEWIQGFGKYEDYLEVMGKWERIELPSSGNPQRIRTHRNRYPLANNSNNG